MEFIGRQIELGLAVESVRGDAETQAAKWVKNVTASIISKVEKVRDDGKRGRLELQEGSRVVQKWYDGSLEGLLHADVIGYLLTNLYGADDPTSLGDSVYSHEFTLDQDITHATLTAIAKDGAVSQKILNGGAVNSLSISAAIDNYVRFASEIIFLGAEDDTDSPTYDTEYDFIAKDITVKFADTENGLAQATAIKAKSITINWAANVIRNHVFGAYAPDANYNSGFGLEIELTRDYTDDTFKDLWEGDGTEYAQIAIVGSQDIGGANHPSLTLILNKTQVTAWERSGGADELVTENVTLVAFFNEDDDEQSMLTLVNNTAVYITPES